jgi:uncharacterized protein involved in propanediol utilization
LIRAFLHIETIVRSFPRRFELPANKSSRFGFGYFMNEMVPNPMKTHPGNGVASAAVVQSLSLKTGKGRSIAQHGELFQGQIEDLRRERRRCLVSLPCHAMSSQATFDPDYSCKTVVRPPHKQKSRKVAEMTLAYLNAPHVGGVLTIESTIPESKGYGSSTADCVSAAIAAADSCGRTLREAEIAKLVVDAEIASDNFMFSHAVLFAHREGVIIEDYARDFPKFEVLGIDTAPEDHVETLKYPPADYSWRQLQSFVTLSNALRRGIRAHDIQLLGRVATASAHINEQFLPKPRFKELQKIAEYAGAVGVSVAHSGTVVSILLDPDDLRLEYKVDQIMKDFSHLGISQVLRFRT